VSKSNRQHGGVVKSPAGIEQPSSNVTQDQTDGVKQNGRLNTRSDKHWWSSFTKDIGMFLLTAATLVVLSIYTCYTGRLVTDTETSYTAVQRAFVSPEQPIKTEATGSGSDIIWTFTSIIRNDGATPTKDLQFYQSTPCAPRGGALILPERTGPLFQCNVYTKGGQVLPAEPSDEEEVFRKKDRFHIQAYSLAPHGSVTVDKVSMSETDLNKMAADGHPWFIQGIVHYNDIFPNSKAHRTEYCVTIVMWKDSPLYIPCPKWNCTDDECN
jgi:hypothetical protein